jgi:hypothetical protein
MLIEVSELLLAFPIVLPLSVPVPVMGTEHRGIDFAFRPDASATQLSPAAGVFTGA